MPLTDRDDYRAMLAAVCAAPGDDLPRLIMADALEAGDGGFPADPARGEFIRCQCELARHPHCPFTYTHPLESGNRNPHVRYLIEPGPEPKEPCGWCPVCKLRRRERELLKSHPKGWLPDAIHDLYLFVQEDVIEGQLIRFRRGFVDRVACSWEAFARHGRDIAAVTPLTEVELSDRPQVVTHGAGMDSEGLLAFYYRLDRSIPIPPGMDTSRDIRPYMEYHAASLAKLPNGRGREGDGPDDLVIRLLKAEFGADITFRLPSVGGFDPGAASGDFTVRGFVRP